MFSGYWCCHSWRVFVSSCSGIPWFCSHSFSSFLHYLLCWCFPFIFLYFVVMPYFFLSILSVLSVFALYFLQYYLLYPCLCLIFPYFVVIASFLSFSTYLFHPCLPPMSLCGLTRLSLLISQYPCVSCISSFIFSSDKVILTYFYWSLNWRMLVFRKWVHMWCFPPVMCQLWNGWSQAQRCISESFLLPLLLLLLHFILVYNWMNVESFLIHRWQLCCPVSG